METENKEKPAFEVRDSKDVVYKMVDDMIKQVVIAAQKDLEGMKKQAEGIVNAVRIQREHAANKPR